MRKKVLITGGAGFIGKNLIDRIKKSLRKNYSNIHIIILDNFSTGQRSYIDKDSEVYEMDIRDQRAKEIAKKSDIIIHLAAMSGVMPSIENPLECTDINVFGTVNLLDGARQGNCEKFIFASSGGTILGMQEPPVHEETIPNPTSPYGASKVCGENYCSSYYQTFGLNTIILRFGNVYGPWSLHKTGNLIPNFLIKLRENEKLPIYGDGNQTRDFIYVNDLTEAICDAALSNFGGEIFQLANSKEYTINEVFKIMNNHAQEIFGKGVVPEYMDERTGEVRRNYSIIEKARKLLIWEPKNDIDEGIKKTFEWFKCHISI